MAEDLDVLGVQPGQTFDAPAVGSPLKPRPKASKSKLRSRDKGQSAAKRRCVSTACIACRRRKSKCDGTIPSCAACAQVYGTECVYDPNSDHRRKGVYKKDIDGLKTRNSTLQTLIQAILNYPEHEVPALVRQIRTCENLDDVAEQITAREASWEEDAEDTDSQNPESTASIQTFEAELAGKMGELRLENGTLQFIGGTSNLLYLDTDLQNEDISTINLNGARYQRQEDAIASWTDVTSDAELITHLINMYFSWHYTYFAVLSKQLFFRDFLRGKPSQDPVRTNDHCSSLLVNAMLALGCHFTSRPAARADYDDPTTAGDHFFKEAKRILLENDEHESPRLPTVQALALMSAREAGCGLEAKGWVYSGMSFRMACDLGLNVDSTHTGSARCDPAEIDARRITFWGCFLYDKCWSNYLGRPPQLPLSNSTSQKFDVFPTEDSELWSPWTDLGPGQLHAQPSRTRAVALQISLLCEISSDLLFTFYHPTHIEKPLGKQAELKKLSELHTRLEAWRKNLPKEMEPKEGQLPHVLVMHMFHQLLFIHCFRPFLRHNYTHSPFPAHVSPRKLCTHAATTISKYLRLYKRTYGLRQVCNLAVYIAHSACTIHLLNLPDKDARRDIIHGVRQLEEISETWPCARRTLSILSLQVRKWSIDIPEEAATVLQRVDAKYGVLRFQDQHSNRSESKSPGTLQASPSPFPQGPRDESFMNGEKSFGVPDTRNPIAAAPIGVVHDAHTSAPLQLPTNPHQQLYSLPIEKQLAPELLTHENLSQTQALPTALFGSTSAMFEDSRDWWLKDQSMIFDSWMVEGSGVDMGQFDGFDNEIDGIIHGNRGHGSMNGGIGGTMNGRIGGTVYGNHSIGGMGYMNFGASGYGAGDGNVY